MTSTISDNLLFSILNAINSVTKSFPQIVVKIGSLNPEYFNSTVNINNEEKEFNIDSDYDLRNIKFNYKRETTLKFTILLTRNLIKETVEELNSLFRITSGINNQRYDVISLDSSRSINVLYKKEHYDELSHLSHEACGVHPLNLI